MKETSHIVMYSRKLVEVGGITCEFYFCHNFRCCKVYVNETVCSGFTYLPHQRPADRNR